MYLFIFRHLGSQLAEMEKVIGKMMETDFLRYITADLNRPHTEYLIMEEVIIHLVFWKILIPSTFYCISYVCICSNLECTIKMLLSCLKFFLKGKDAKKLT